MLDGGELKYCLTETNEILNLVCHPNVRVLYDDFAERGLEVPDDVLLALARHNDSRFIGALLELLADPGDEEENAQEGPQAEAQKKQAQKKQTKVRIYRTLSASTDVRALDTFLAGLHDEDRLVRVYCAAGLQRICLDLQARKFAAPQRDAVAQRLIEALEATSDPKLVQSLIQALGYSGYRDAAYVVHHYLRSRSRVERMAAIEALARLGAGDYAEDIADLLLDDEDQTVRRAAAQALAQLATMEEVPLLIEGLRAGDTVVRKRVLVALTRVTGQSFGPNPNQWRQWWEAPPEPQN